MQEIFFELNRQSTLEQKFGRFLSQVTVNSSPKEIKNDQGMQSSPYTSYPSLHRYILRPCRSVQKIYRWLAQRTSICKLFILSFLDSGLGQILLHLVLLIYGILVFVIFLFFLFALLPLELLIQRFKKIDLTYSFLIPAVSFLIDSPIIKEQVNTYYISEFHSPFSSGKEKFLNFVEHFLFLCFKSFPKRLRNRKEYWRKMKQALNEKSNQKQSPQIKLNSPSHEPVNISQVLRQGGDLWQVLYEINESDASTFLQQQLSPEELKTWNNLTSEQDISNVLWSTLDTIQHPGNQEFQDLEHQLQEAEKTLERKRKSNEVNVTQKLSHRKLTALWTPVFNGIARLKFSKEDIETFSASGQSFQKFRETITSWQGICALFFMGLFIAITTSTEGRTQIAQLLLGILKNPTLQQWLQSLPDWLQTIPTYLQTFITWVRNNLPSWFQITSTTLIALIPALKALTTYIDSVQKEQARIQGERETLLKQSEGTLSTEAQEVAQLRLKVAEKRQRLGPNAQYPSLLDFVNARLSGDDYGKQLGLMQQVKQDLAALSARLTPNPSNQTEIEKLFPRGPARVFLYIDDLDRCPPDRVVEVLETVQLLLNTELFVVILAIDDRYIARALEQVYEGVLKRRGKPSGIDYLEKIIQIPYRMRPISPDTVENYFRSQLKIKEPEVSSCQDSSISIDPNPPAPSSPDPASPPQSTLDQEQPAYTNSAPAPDVGIPPAIVLPDPTIASQSLESDSRPNAQEPSSPRRDNSTEPSPTASIPSAETIPASTPPTPAEQSYIETIATVEEFDPKELELLVNCCKHVDITPRTGKRLINIYKILQLIWNTRSKKTPPQPPPSFQDKQIIMSFLALCGRYPDFMRSLFEEIDIRLETATFKPGNGETATNTCIELHLSELLSEIQPQFTLDNRLDFHTQREWKRFDIDIRRMLQQATNTQNDPSFKLDRKTFSLMLSFSFVGDLGYDPDDFNLH